MLSCVSIGFYYAKRGKIRLTARIDDYKEKKILADYVQTQNMRETARKNGVSDKTVKRVVNDSPDIMAEIEQQEAKNTADILSYMESKKAVVCEIIGKGLDVLNDEEKLRGASPAQITTALGTLIDKFTAFAAAPADEEHEDELSRSLREIAQELDNEGTY